MSKSLPARPNLEQLRNQAKDLLKSFLSGNPAAAQRFLDFHPEPARASFTLADAQLVVAREYGFATWPKLKGHVQSIQLDTADPMELFKQAFTNDDAPLFRRLLERHPEFKARINEPVAAFDAPVITQVRSRAMLDVLLDAGANINARSRWWAGGFGLLDHAEPDLANYAVQRGAIVDVHAAARLGMLDKLRDFISANPDLVHARGGDGQTPLHFARTLDVATFLIVHGADIDARDVDHESTPAQHMIRDRQEIVRYLIQRGCKTDVLMAAALGDVNLVQMHLDADPGCVRMRVSNEFFPMINRKSGGTIYRWTLGWHVSPHDVARSFQHPDVLHLLLQRSPLDVQLLDACWNACEPLVRSLIARDPDLIPTLSPASRRQVAHAARNNNHHAVRLMLAAGLPPDALGQHNATPLHWAAFHGNVDMLREILGYNPPINTTDADFQSTPLGWAIHGSVHGWYCATGDYPTVVQLLLDAGANPPHVITGGSDAVQTVLRHHGPRD